MNAVIQHEPSQIQTVNDPAPMVAMIERIVMDPSIPIDRLEQVLAMKERMEDRSRQQAREDDELRAKRAYFAAMSKCQKELPVVTKNKNNDHTKSNYADLAAIEEQAMPIIHAHGFGVSFQPDGYNDKGELRILWEISHEEGHARNGVGEIPVDGAGSQGKVNKTGTQAFGSTATYGRRYLLCMLFNISTGDDRDGNRIQERQVPVFLSAEQIEALQTKIIEAGANPVKFMKVAGIEKLSDMLASDFQAAMTGLDDYAAKKANANA